MSKFARLLEREGEQVLVVKDRGPDGQPQLIIRFNTPKGNHARLNFEFEQEGDREVAFGMTDENVWKLVDETNGESPF